LSEKCGTGNALENYAALFFYKNWALVCIILVVKEVVYCVSDGSIFLVPVVVKFVHDLR
jgi:hypothetical protein